MIAFNEQFSAYCQLNTSCYMHFLALTKFNHVQIRIWMLVVSNEAFHSNSTGREEPTKTDRGEGGWQSTKNQLIQPKN